MSNKPPAFQFYARDWLADSKVRQLRLDERGAYCDLLCVQWNEGQIPTDPDAAGMCIGIHPETWPEWRSRIWPRVVTFFPNGRNPRLAEYRQALEKLRKKASKDGKRGARKRWHDNDVNGVAMATPCEPHWGGHSTASATAPASNASTNVEAAAPNDVEKWNDRLAPLARQLGGDEKVGDWLKWAKACGAPKKCDQVEAWMWGLWKLRELGALEWIPKGQDVGPAVFRTPHSPQLLIDCDTAYHRYAPNEGAQVVRGLT
jgi:uncharacterized protein YdaU (DUF1376 family)